MTAEEDRVARTRLFSYLERLRANGQPVPCLDIDPHDRHLWTSDDPGEAELAATLCVPCRAARECGEYGRAHPREFGVYGGMTTAERQPRKGRRPRKAKTETKETAA